MKEREKGRKDIRKEGKEGKYNKRYLKYSRSRSSVAVLGQIHKDLCRGPDSTKVPLARIEV